MEPTNPRALLQRLESLQAAGVTVLPRKQGQPRGAASPVPTSTHAPVEPLATESIQQEKANENRAAPTVARVERREPLLPTPVAAPSSASTLEVLSQEVASCSACEELAGSRTQTVFGVGNPKARLCFLGEAPGADEDRLGEPFVGRAGQLLDKMLTACGLSRGEVYILNVLKCRPPGNRNPTPHEATNCRGFLERQLELIDPEFICCLGAVAAQNFLQTETTIGRLRGSVHRHAGRKVVCTYHPAYLLRNPSAKGAAWADLQMLMSEMGIEIPKR